MRHRLIALRQPPPQVIDALSERYDIDVIAEPGSDWHVERPDEVRGLINFAGTLGADVMDRLPGLQIISHMGVGYDGVDVSAALDRGIVVTHTRDVLNADVANFAFLMLLAASREYVRQDTHVRTGAWESGQTPLTWSIEGKTIGIVGLGRIGKNLAQKLTAFNVTVLYHGRGPQPVPYEYCSDLVDMAKRCCALILLLPGGSGTDQLVGGDVLTALGPDAGLVNAARGSVVDQDALVSALDSGALGWAALDVFANEPHVPQKLRDMPNVLLSPHAASATVETRSAMFQLVADNIRAFFEDGRALTPIPECDG